MPKVELSEKALSQLDEWIKIHPRTASKILDLIQECSKTPFEGKGKPEALKHDLKGKWSRRITDEHRLIYEIENNILKIISCKYHYE